MVKCKYLLEQIQVLVVSSHFAGDFPPRGQKNVIDTKKAFSVSSFKLHILRY